MYCRKLHLLIRISKVLWFRVGLVSLLWDCHSGEDWKLWIIKYLPTSRTQVFGTCSHNFEGMQQRSMGTYIPEERYVQEVSIDNG
ncbi:hypothetical protein J6590_066661 [Homalodisca vitripennis]|nr:hypothetical protein J6590_066661 [Homalodisca vitripennis]